MRNNFLRKLALFIIGYCIYIAIEVTFRGYSYTEMGICGGILFLFIDLLNDKIFEYDTDLFFQGCVGSATITVVELIVGEIVRLFNFSPMWDYSNMWLNFDGVICLPFSLAWIGLSMVAVVLADCINYYVFRVGEVPHYYLFKHKFKMKGM